MFATKRIIATFLLGVLLGSTAHASDQPRISKAEWLGSSVSLTFDAPMLTWIGRSSIPSISIEPEFACQWMWSDDTTLACNAESPGALPKAATRYTISVDGRLWSQQGAEIGHQSVTAETERPTVGASVDSWKDGEPVIDVLASPGVSTAELRSHLHARLESGKPAEFDLSEAESVPDYGPGPPPSSRWHIVFRRGEDTEDVVLLSIKPGLRTSIGDLPGVQDEVLLRAVLSERFHVRLAACLDKPDSGWSGQIVRGPITLACAAGATIALEFSKPLSKDSLMAFRAGLPADVRFGQVIASPYSGPRKGDNANERPSYYIYLSSRTPGARPRIDIPAAPAKLTAEDGESLEAPIALVINTGDFHPKYELAPARMVLPLNADAPLIFAGVNQPQLEIEQREIGGGEVATQRQMLSTPPRNTLVHLAPPTSNRDVRRNGGIADGVLRPQGDKEYWNRTNYQLAYAAFNITTVVSAHQFLVWVTDWDKAASVAGAKVELLRVTRPDVIKPMASAITGEDGIAVVDVSELGQHTGDGGIMIRATRGDRRAIVPISAAITHSHRSRDEGSGGHVDYSASAGEGSLATWGVTDRPLYRPGETVNYQLWVRQRDANHLVAAKSVETMAFVIRSHYGDNRLTTFTAKPDSYGSISGTWHLSAQMHDDDYCIVPEDAQRWGDSPAPCFRVTGYHVNELWAELRADRDFAFDGDTVTLDASGGYYSGGPAANTAVELQSLLTPLRIEEAYPAVREFTFVDPYQDTAGAGGEQFTTVMPHALHTDAQGHARSDVKLTNAGLLTMLKNTDRRPIPFGRVEFTASVSSGKSSIATSAPAALRFSRYARFVGLKLNSWILRTDSDPELEAVVLTAKGERVPDALVQLDIDDVATEGSDGKGERKTIGHCELRAGQMTPCRFRAPHTGSYRFRASSEGALETSIERFAFVDANWKPQKDEDRASLTTATKSIAAGLPLHVVLTQPFAKARALMTVAHGRVLKHWIQPLDGPVTEFDVSTQRDWQPGFTLSASVLDAGEGALLQEPGKLLEMAHLDVELESASVKPAVSLSVDRGPVHPGDEIAITVRNDADEPVEATLAVVDDANRALAPEFSAAADPMTDKWLGRLRQWTLPAWYGLGDWPRTLDTRATGANSLFQFATYNSNVGGGGNLETIVVTGSNIRAVDLFTRGAPNDHSLGKPQRDTGINKGALRSHFVESAGWRPALEIPAKSSQVVRIHLPDNLTRWRVLAWSADKDDRFDLAQTTVEAMLPIELRADAPTRLFPGDQARISVSVRNHSQSTQPIDTSLTVNGAGVSRHATRSAPIPPNEQGSVSVVAQPDSTGVIDVVGRAQRGLDADGVAANVEVASPVIRAQLPVAGWLARDGAQLKLPPLPAGASHAQLQLELSRGPLTLAKTWIVALRDYPHRCWEQILSRAMGAAAAKKLSLGGEWPDSDAVVKEALNSAAEFQDSQGFFHFFADSYYDDSTASTQNLYLTAYTIGRLRILSELGYNVPHSVVASAAKLLDHSHPRGYQRSDIEAWASILRVLPSAAALPDDLVNNIWGERRKVSWFARAELAQALGGRKEYSEKTAALLDELRQAGVLRADRRVIPTATYPSWWPFDLTLRDQCAVIDALTALDHSPDGRQVRDELVRGLSDLYAGGAPTWDTQADSTCLIALMHVTAESQAQGSKSSIAVSAGEHASTLELAPEQTIAEWSANLSEIPPALNLRVENGSSSFLSFVARLAYDEDGRRAESAAVGYALQRHYSVLRDHQWKDVRAVPVREGDWVQVTLRIENKAMRYFVAISDNVVGGLRPTDISLAGISDIELRSLAAYDSPFFNARQVDDRFARFYAEQLPPGTHEIHYYARATHAGDYAAIPATAELMYGSASKARTASSRLLIKAGPVTGPRKSSPSPP